MDIQLTKTTQIFKDIDTVIFDIGNVLIHFDWAGYLKTLNFDEETYEHVTNAMFLNEDWDKGDSGLCTTEEWLQMFIENDPEYEQEICKTFEGFGASIVPYSITEEWLSYFKENGVKRYYLSNYSEEMYRQSKEQLSFIEDFDGGIFSWKEKCMKPQSKIYEILLNRYHINPAKTVFFDDNTENIEAAENAGIHGIVFTTDVPFQMLGK
ncbi:MAG: HAD-IA family hydrolase [Lachnospiraceae bacterium]|nr:HAD-IA family hydrolase [Lachnospiraceae bacterium]